jgi:hypothetical protein
MKPKYLLLIGLVLVNYPIYRLLFRVLFRPIAPKDETSQEPRPESLTLRQLFNPVFLRDSGGETKLFLLVLAAALIVYIEYVALLAIFPGLRDIAVLGKLSF